MSNEQVKDATKDLVDEVFCKEDRTKALTEDILKGIVDNHQTKGMTENFFAIVFQKNDVLGAIGQSMG